MLAKCGEAIVIHDTTVDRTTNGEGKVAELDYAQICQLDAGSWFDSAYAGEKIPTFLEVIQCLGELGLGANVEIKPSQGQDKPTALKVLEMIHAHWPSHLPAPLVSSFSLESLKVVREKDDNVFMGMLLDEWRDDWANTADALDCATVHVNQKALTPKGVQAIQQTGRLCLSYVVNEQALKNKLMGWGVDAVFTDDPSQVKP